MNGNRLIPIAAALVLCGCGDAGGPSLQLSPVMQIIEGDNQVDTVAKQLPIAITARAEDKLSAQPARGVVLNWFRIVGTDSTFIGAALTNDSGIARLRPTLATKAGPQSFIAWALDADGQRSDYAAATATALPDRAFQILISVESVTTWVGDPVRSGAYAGAWDQFMNFVGAPNFAPTPGWTVRADTAWAGAEIRTDLSLHRDGVQVSLRAIALRDLRRQRWSLTYSCGDTVPPVVRDEFRVQWVDLQGASDSVTLLGSPDTDHGFDLWFTSTLIRGLYRQLLDGTELRPTDTTIAITRLRISEQGVGWIVPGAFETRPGRFLTAAQIPAVWSGAAYDGGNLGLCAQNAFEDYRYAYSGTPSFQMALTALP
jgi:hypothetical protein